LSGDGVAGLSVKEEKLNLRFAQLVPENETIRRLGPPDVEVTGLTYRSQQVKPGWLFAAIPGAKVDGRRFIPDAIENGAVALIVKDAPASLPPEIAIAVVNDPRRTLAKAAGRFFGHPSRKMEVVGITGTNGKTTIAFLVESILRKAGRNPIVIGTINYRLGELKRPAPVTTPESVDLQGILAEMLDMGADSAIIEVSSHALEQGRVWGLKFAARVYTNLSRDHLDYHGSMEEYFDAKSRLFIDRQFADSGPAVVNAEDEWGTRLLEKISYDAISYGIDTDANVKATRWNADESGISIRVLTPRWEDEIRSALLGRFNVYNILAAVAVAEALDVDPGAIKRGIESLTKVPGRLEPVPNPRGITVLVDYSHTPDALENALEAVREFTRGKLLVVVGCGGDRDRGKRPIMGKLAAQKADVAVITSDNPRTEDPLAIIKDILEGVDGTDSLKIEPDQNPPDKRVYWVEPDRRKAIFGAIAAAREGDSVLVAGKGHEDYQILGERRIHFDDREVAREALEE